VVFIERPLILLINEPIPLPLIVFVDKAIVGLALVPQQIPLAVILAPPSFEIVPPEIAVVVVIDETAVVDIVGALITIVVFKLSSLEDVEEFPSALLE
jgi:hypothetical protein